MRQKRRDRLEQALAELEAEFRTQLIAALRKCRDGYWGLLDQNEGVALPDALRQEIYVESGAQKLDRMAAEIAEIRGSLDMEAFTLHTKLLASRARKKSNDLGEPRLASLWLEELEG